MDCRHSVGLGSSHRQNRAIHWSFPLGTSTCPYICPGRSNFLGNIFSNKQSLASCTSPALARRGKSKRHRPGTGCRRRPSDLSCSTHLSCMRPACEELRRAEWSSFRVVLANLGGVGRESVVSELDGQLKVFLATTATKGFLGTNHHQPPPPPTPPPTNHQPTTNQPPTNHQPTTNQPPTNHQPPPTLLLLTGHVGRVTYFTFFAGYWCN
jgi:hypothetical protein